MGSARLIVALAVVAIATTSSLVAATDYFVGDYNGWRLNYDYQTWLSGKIFIVGDTLIFQYEKGSHDVLDVDAESYKNCAFPENATPLTKGYDVVNLTSSGQKWYVCGFEGHCQSGMKFSITVWESEGAALGAAAGEDSAAGLAAATDATLDKMMGGVPRTASQEFIPWMMAGFVVFAMIIA